MDMYQEIIKRLLEGDTEGVSNLIKKALDLKYPPEGLITECLIKGVEVLAEKFKTQSVLVPEAWIVTRALNVGIDEINLYLKDKNIDNKRKYKGRVIIGTVEGDIHDIGKNIVKMITQSAGLEVIDLGVDVRKRDFVEAIKKYEPQIVMISALLTTTLKSMGDTVKEIEKEGLRDRVIIFLGGAPLTYEYAIKIGADYYTKDVIELKDLLNNNINKILKNKG